MTPKFTAFNDMCKDGLLSLFEITDEDFDYQMWLYNNRPNKNVELKASLSQLFEMDYRSYCFIIMLLYPLDYQQLARIQNIIQMEAMYHYSSIFQYDLRESYSGLTTEVSADINQFMEMPTLLTSDLFKITRTQMRGY
jgi:hypothetical protein